MGTPIPFAAMWEPVDLKAYRQAGESWESVTLADIETVRE